MRIWAIASRSPSFFSPLGLPLLRHADGTRFGLPASRWMLEAGAVFLRTETELIMKGRRVVPGVLTAAGFDFIFPSWPGAAQNLVRRWPVDQD